MFAWLLRLLKSQLKSVGKLIKSPKKTIGNRIKNVFKFKKKTQGLKNKINKVKKAIPQTPRTKLINKIIDKAQVIDRMKDNVSQILRGKSSAVIEKTEFIKSVINNPKLLQLVSDEELENMNKLADKELESLNINPDEIDLTHQQEYDLTLLNSYEAYMDNWKSKFFDSDETEHMTDDEKQEIWAGIEETRTYEWYVSNKINKE